SWPYDLSKAGARVQKKNYRPNATYEEKEAMDLYNHTASWKEIMVRAYYKYDKEGSYQQALRAAQSLILEYPEEGKLYRLAGEMCLKLNEAKKANYYFAKYNQLRAQRGRITRDSRYLCRKKNGFGDENETLLSSFLVFDCRPPIAEKKPKEIERNRR